MDETLDLDELLAEVAQAQERLAAIYSKVKHARDYARHYRPD